MQPTKGLEVCYAVDDLEAIKELVDQLQGFLKAIELYPESIVQLTKGMAALIEQEHMRQIKVHTGRINEQVQMLKGLQ